MNQRQIILPTSEMPRQWYNILADIKMNPPLGPDGNPISPDALAPVSVVMRSIPNSLL